VLLASLAFSSVSLAQTPAQVATQWLKRKSWLVQRKPRFFEKV
jgi:hypothetical protein